MTRHAERHALAWGAVVAALTSVHHVYGAIVYQTPSRFHAVFLAGGALVVMLGALLIGRRWEKTWFGQAAWWIFFGVNAVVLVLLIGAFEGAYNHVLKNALWLAGLPVRELRVLFPAPTYELPNDWFFELTGIAQVVPAAVTAGWLATLLTERFGARGSRAVVRRGDVLPRRTLVTVGGDRIAIPDSTHLTHLQLRRFAGCPVCNLHLRSLVTERAAIEAAGVREIVVFHSSAEELRRYEDDLPFALVADPEKRLYRELGVESSRRALLDPGAWPGIVKGVLAASWGLALGRPVPPLRPAGGSFGLPADFLIDRDGRVLAVKYGEHADDQWSAAELLALAGAPRRRAAELGVTAIGP